MPTTIAIPRPGADEYVQYYDRYIRLVKGDDALPTLETHLDRWLPTLRRISEAQGLHRYAPGKWSVKEVLGHVCDGERVFCYRALRFARADQTPLPGFDENAWVPASASDRRPIGEIVDELQAVRAASVALFRAMDQDMLARRGKANDQAISARALAWIIAGHAMHHQAGLRENYGIAG
jgi:arylsulfatase A-like enzyme